jgi:hypothetical protein
MAVESTCGGAIPCRRIFSMASDLTTTGPNVRTLLEDGNARASAVLTGGSILWKVLAYAEHIDFFLSFKGEKFSMIFDFFESAGWWMLAAVGILWFMATRGKGKEFAPQPLNWAFLLSCALMAFAFGSLITVKSSGQVPTVIVGWGGNATQMPSWTPRGSCLSKTPTRLFWYAG